MAWRGARAAACFTVGTRKRRAAFGTALRIGVVVTAGILCGSVAWAEDYRLGSSDVVRIKIQGWPELAGDYTIGPEGTLALPQVGEVRAAGLSMRELTERVDSRVRERGFKDDRTVIAIEISKFRPMFVMGDVQRPGDYPWRPALTVLQAVALAGGFARPPALGGMRLDRELTVNESELRSSLSRRDRIAVRVARLAAWVEGRTDFEEPRSLSRKAEDVAVAMDGERAIMRLEIEREATERKSVEAIKAIYVDEITFMTGQIEALKRELTSLQQLVSEYRGLSNRGLAVLPNLATLERALAQNQNDQLGLRTQIARTRESIELAEQRIKEAAGERRRDRYRELQSVRQDLAEVDAKLALSRDLIDEVYAAAEIEARDVNVDPQQRRAITVVRNVDGLLQEIPADDGMRILPDDVVKVAPLRRRPASVRDRSERAATR